VRGRKRRTETPESSAHPLQGKQRHDTRSWATSTHAHLEGAGVAKVGLAVEVLPTAGNGEALHSWNLGLSG
jgi:hypothetical protein